MITTYQMTDEIAFQLGKGDYPSFYDSPEWRPNIEKFEYVHFFNWGNPIEGRQENEESWMWIFYGQLKEDCFTNLDFKKSYIRGILNSYAGKVLETSIVFNFANSSKTRDRVAKWADEILKDKFGGQKTWSIKKDETPTCPMIVRLFIEADEEMIKFLVKD